MLCGSEAYAALKKLGVWGQSPRENFSRPGSLDSRKRGQRPSFTRQNILDLPYPPYGTDFIAFWENLEDNLFEKWGAGTAQSLG